MCFSKAKRTDGIIQAIENGTLDEYHDLQDKRKKKRKIKASR